MTDTEQLDPAAPTESSASIETELAAQPPTVLCVDDEANILSALKRLFRPTGYNVLLANSGAEGLLAIEQAEANGGSVDLVISDMRMPEMTGAQFLAQVRERWPRITRVLLTGYADIESTVSAINQGEIYRYISKPWNDSDVLLTVSGAMERLALQREKERLEALTQEQNDALRELNQHLEDKVRERTEELHQANDHLKKNFITSIRVFANIIELREGRMAGHSRRVADLANKMARHMNLDPKDVQDVFVAGLLHDIGKISLPDELLGKPPAQLNSEEFGHWRKHPIKGEQALMALEDLRGAARLIRAHHERFDGQGYPDGASGSNIPLGARILALANDYDGLVQGTFSGKKMTESDAAQFIAQSREKRYDPEVVDAFFALSGMDPSGEASASAMLEVTTKDLKPGMVLARDFINREGVLLLSTGHQLNESLIRQIREYERSEKERAENEAEEGEENPIAELPMLLYVRPPRR